jgi:hypothetical protein
MACLHPSPSPYSDPSPWAKAKNFGAGHKAHGTGEQTLGSEKVGEAQRLGERDEAYFVSQPVESAAFSKVRRGKGRLGCGKQNSRRVCCCSAR